MIEGMMKAPSLLLSMSVRQLADFQNDGLIRKSVADAEPAFIALLVVSFTYLGYLIWSKEERPPSFDVELRDLINYAVLAVEMGGRAVVQVQRESNISIRTKGKTDVGKEESLTKADLVSNHLILGLLKRLPIFNIVTEEKSEHLTDKEVEKYCSDNYEIWLGLKDTLKEFPTRRVALNRVALWIDPLDATQEYIGWMDKWPISFSNYTRYTYVPEGLNEYVTVMACLAIDGQPYFGVIHLPFSNETVFGLVDYGVRDSSGANIELVSRKMEMAERSVVVSRSHAGKVRELIDRAFAGERHQVVTAGGAGYKALSLIRGSCDLYLHSSTVKKWDLCAGDALIRAAGGALIDFDGRPIDYAAHSNPLHKRGVLASVRNPYSTLAKIKQHLPPS